VTQNLEKLIKDKRTVFLSYFLKICEGECFALEVICSNPRLKDTILLGKLVPAIVEILCIARHLTIVLFYFDNLILVDNFSFFQLGCVKYEKLSISILLEIREELSSLFLSILPLSIKFLAPSFTLDHEIGFSVFFDKYIEPSTCGTMSNGEFFFEE
jgi:hypothetical protein